MESFKKLIGERIKRHRKEIQMTQEELGEALGTDQSRIARWESGRHLPDDRYKGPLAKALSVSEETLFSVEDESNPDTPTQSAMAQTIALLQKEIDQLRAAATAKVAERSATYDPNLSETKRDLVAAIPLIDEGFARQVLGTIELHLGDKSKNRRRSR